MKAFFVTRFMHSHAFAWVTGLMALAGALIYYFFMGDLSWISGDSGFALPSANEWIPSHNVDFAVNIAANILVAAVVAYILKAFSVVRPPSALPLAMFAVLQGATPDCLVQFYSGTLLVLALAIGIALLFSCYKQPQATRRIFLVFFLLSLGTATQSCFAPYIIVFLGGCAQMRVFNRRTVLAAIFGLVTPWWLLFGFGIISADELHLPELVSIFSVIDPDETLLLLATVGTSALLALFCFALNAAKAIAYNARTRAFNGLFALLSAVTIFAACADYRNILSYLPTLNLCAAYQIGHYFSAHRADRSYLAIIGITAIYIAYYICLTVM